MKKHLRDILWLAVLVFYILAGTPLVPFHGDESTLIYMSRDYDYLFRAQDTSLIRYADPPLRTTEQHLRLLNGVIHRYLVGFLRHLAGHRLQEVNEQWDWGADWRYNQQTGHAPDDELLMLGRWASSLLFAAGVVVIFMIGLNLQGRLVAYLASLYYALNPALLLNGRRAMMEGSLILFGLFVVLAAIWFLRQRSWPDAVLLGVMSGLAVSAKHPGAIMVAAVFAGCGVYALLRLSRREFIRVMGWLISASVIAFVAFYVLNPVWWENPVERAGQVLDSRMALLEGQVETFGGYDSLADQMAGFGRQVFIVRPQYYEVEGWEDYIGDQIHRYEASPWRGISLGGTLLGGIVVFVLSCAGFIALWRKDQQERTPAPWLIAIWSVIVLMTSLLLTPLEWQRYYLLTYPAVGLLASTGIAWLAETISAIRASHRRASAVQSVS